MLAIHWSPVKNTKKILKNGILKSKDGLYCFPLTGERNLDQNWVILFNHLKFREQKKYNGFVFRIEKEDMPASFGSFWDHGDDDEIIINDIDELELRYRERIIQKMGEKQAKLEFSKTEEYSKKAKEYLLERKTSNRSINDPELLEFIFKMHIESQIFNKYKGAPVIYVDREKDSIFLEKGKIEIQKNKGLLSEALQDIELLNNAFSDWQIILSRSISPNRIIKIITNQDEYGKILHKNKKYEYTENYTDDYQ